MLKLIYHTVVFGPIDLEFDGPVIRVGRSEDNDLVLRHPSIEPYHCLLVFRGEKVLCLPPSQDVPAQTELRHLTGPEFGIGDSLQIGDLRFSLAHSPRTVGVPGIDSPGSLTGDSECDTAFRRDVELRPGGYYCAHCRRWIPDAEVKRVGLVGRAKRDLCPKCSRPLETRPERAKVLR